MAQAVAQYRRASSLSRKAVIMLGVLSCAPLVFMIREIIGGDFHGLKVSNADVLGGGANLLLMATLTITPLVTLTGARWFVPLRWWFGVIFFSTAVVDLVIASIVTGEDFTGGFLGRIAGHTFLLAGTTATVLSLALAVTANHRSQVWLGKYWRTVQKLTYVIWALIVIHLALLFGLTGSRFLQELTVTYPLVMLRLGPIQRFAVFYRGRWFACLILAPLVLLWMWGFGHLVAEEINRGVNALSSHPADS